MLSLNKLIAFVPTRDASQARSFYEGKLGLRFVSDDPFALLLDAGGIMVRVVKLQQYEPQQFTILGWEVENIDDAVAHLDGKGIRFEKYGMNGQDERGIWTAPGGARVAWFKDPDGNVLSVSQHAG